MGPSVKFVLAIIDSISQKKMGVNFFIRKKTIRGGGPRGGLAKDHKKYVFFFRTPSLSMLLSFLSVFNAGVHVHGANLTNELNSLVWIYPPLKLVNGFRELLQQAFQ